MPDDHALEALIEARDQSMSSVPTDLMVRLLAVEHDYIFRDAEDLALRAVEAVIDEYLNAGVGK